MPQSEDNAVLRDHVKMANVTRFHFDHSKLYKERNVV